MKDIVRLLGGLAPIGMIVACGAIAEPSASPSQRSSVPRITNEDFARSDRFLRGSAGTDIRNGDIEYQWIGVGDTFYYRSQSAEGTRYLLVQSATGRKTPLFDHQSMAAGLSQALHIPVDARSLPISRLTRLDRDRYEVAANGKTLHCDLSAKTCDEQRKAGEDPTAMPAPNRRYAVFSRDYNLWLRDTSSGQERALISDGVRGWSYGRLPESSVSEVSRRRSGDLRAVGALWSPDGRRFVSYRLDERHVSELALVQNVPEDGSFRPKLHTYRYELVGEKPSEAAYFIYDVEQNKRIDVSYRAVPATLQVTLSKGYLWWSADGSKLYLVDSPATEPFVRLVEIDPDTGAARLMMEERADTTYFPNAFFAGTPSIFVLRNGDVIWFSERSGWGHLYRYDGRTGKLKNAVTRGEWLVRDVQRIDERTGCIYLSGSGRERGEDIYNRHLYRVNLDGTGLQLLTPDAGDHDFPAILPDDVAAMNSFSLGTAQTRRISPNGAYLIDHFSTVTAPGHWILRRRDGSVVARLEDEDASPLPPYTPPEPFVVKSADGRYDLYGLLLKPAGFDPDKRYPVVDHIYPGPQVIKAPKTFAGGGVAFGGSAIFGADQALADLGFVVFQVDGRGGTFRSKAFRDLSYRHMEKAGMLEDHIEALRQLAKSRPWLDMDRVGIFGTSGGGFATAHALIEYPELFKVGISSAGNHEQRAYIRMWGETYHGPPDSTDYAQVFAGKDVSRFKGKLLLAYGDMDDNVHPANTLRLADALIKGNKQFDMLVMPNVNHGIADVPYFQRVTQNYFLKHLMGAELPGDSDVALPGTMRTDH